MKQLNIYLLSFCSYWNNGAIAYIAIAFSFDFPCEFDKINCMWCGWGMVWNCVIHIVAV